MADAQVDGADGRRMSVVFTGQLREPETFRRSLENMAGLAHVDELILATWPAEVEANRALLAELEQRHGLKIATAEPPPEWSGNMLSQMLSLYLGLRHARPGNHVLKTRPDVFINPEALGHVFARDLRIVPPANMGGTPVFGEKVCVWGLEITQPFYIHDLFFFGRAADMTRLVNMDIRYDVVHRMTKEKIHIRRFLHPFLHEFPVFERFLHLAHVVGVTDDYPVEYRHAMLRMLLDDDFYRLVIALYYKVASAFYCLDWGTPDVFEWRDVPETVALGEAMTLEDLYFGKPHLQAMMLGEPSLLDAVAARRFAASPLGEKFTATLDELDALPDLRTAGMDRDFDAAMGRIFDCAEKALQTARAELTAKN